MADKTKTVQGDARVTVTVRGRPQAHARGRQAEVRRGPFARIEPDLGKQAPKALAGLVDMSTVMLVGHALSGGAAIGLRDPYYLTPDLTCGLDSGFRVGPLWPDPRFIDFPTVLVTTPLEVLLDVPDYSQTPTLGAAHKYYDQVTKTWDPYGQGQFDPAVTDYATFLKYFYMAHSYLSVTDMSDATQLSRVNEVLLYQPSNSPNHDWGMPVGPGPQPTVWDSLPLTDLSPGSPPDPYRSIPSRWQLPLNRGLDYGVRLTVCGQSVVLDTSSGRWVAVKTPPGAAAQVADEVLGYDQGTGLGGFAADRWTPGTMKVVLPQGQQLKVAVVSDGPFFEAFDTSDKDNFKITSYPSFGAADATPPQIQGQVAPFVMLVPRWWKYSVDFDAMLAFQAGSLSSIATLPSGFISQTFSGVTFSIGEPQQHLGSYQYVNEVLRVTFGGYKMALTRPCFPEKKTNQAEQPLGKPYFDAAVGYAAMTHDLASLCSNSGRVVIGTEVTSDPDDGGPDMCIPCYAYPPSQYGNWLFANLGGPFDPYGASGSGRPQAPRVEVDLQNLLATGTDAQTIAALVSWIESSAGYKRWWHELDYQAMLGDFSGNSPDQVVAADVVGDLLNGPFVEGSNLGTSQPGGRHNMPVDWATQNGAFSIVTEPARAGSLVGAFALGPKRFYVWRRTDGSGSTPVASGPYDSVWHQTTAAKVPVQSSQVNRQPYIRSAPLDLPGLDVDGLLGGGGPWLYTGPDCFAPVPCIDSD